MRSSRDSYVDMTATIVAFAKPLLDEVPPKTQEHLANLFGRVIDIWNMWVASGPPWNDSRGLDELRDAVASGELSAAEQYIHRILAERWVAAFREDRRLVVEWSVTVENGGAIFRCLGCSATSELLVAFKGAPN